MYTNTELPHSRESNFDSFIESFLRKPSVAPALPTNLDVDEMPDDPQQLKKLIAELQFQNVLMREVLLRARERTQERRRHCEGLLEALEQIGKKLFQDIDNDPFDLNL